MRQYQTCAFALAAASVIATAGAVPANAIVYVSSVIAAGLDNPRGLAFGTDGALYIAEGGSFIPGGPSINGPEGPVVFGASGAITRLAGGVQTRLVTGLPSLAGANGTAAGPQDVAFYNGLGYVLIGFGGNPALRYTDLGADPAAANLASLYSFDSVGTLTKVADIGSYEQSVNPAADQIDSNPFHINAGPNGLLLTDAGGNALLNVTGAGAITAISTFPDVNGADAVPTGVAVGPDGAIYMGQLTGYPFVPGAADIFRIDPVTNDKTIFATGFTNITDIAWGQDGSLYVLQFSDAGILNGGPGSIQKVNSDGTHELIFGGLIAPTGLEIGSDGAFYVTNFSPVAGIGQVLRIAGVPEPASWAMMIAGFALIGGMMRKGRTSIAFA
jgi:hypothetical protein